MHPETGKRRIVKLPDDPKELEAYLSKNGYEPVTEYSDRWNIRAAVSTKRLSEDYYVHLSECYFEKNILCFGAVLLWYDAPVGRYTQGGTKDMSIEDSVSFAVFPAEADLQDTYHRPGVIPQLLKCYCCQIPINEWRDGQPWCPNGHVAVPPGITAEEHVKRDFLNQRNAGLSVYPSKVRAEWFRPKALEDYQTKYPTTAWAYDPADRMLHKETHHRFCIQYTVKGDNDGEA